MYVSLNLTIISELCCRIIGTFHFIIYIRCAKAQCMTLTQIRSAISDGAYFWLFSLTSMPSTQLSETRTYRAIIMDNTAWNRRSRSSKRTTRGQLAHRLSRRAASAQAECFILLYHKRPNNDKQLDANLEIRHRSKKHSRLWGIGNFAGLRIAIANLADELTGSRIKWQGNACCIYTCLSFIGSQLGWKGDTAVITC